MTRPEPKPDPNDDLNSDRVWHTACWLRVVRVEPARAYGYKKKGLLAHLILGWLGSLLLGQFQGSIRPPLRPVPLAPALDLHARRCLEMHQRCLYFLTGLAYQPHLHLPEGLEEFLGDMLLTEGARCPGRHPSLAGGAIIR